MLRRIALLIALALPLSGCVTYEVVERRVYHADGSYSRIYDPYDDGRRYEDGGYGDGRRYEYDRYNGGYGYHDDPYDLWFYGWRGPGTVLYVDPWYDRSYRFGHSRYRRGLGGSAWSWGWSGYGSGYGYGYAPSRPHRPSPPRPPEPRPIEARPLPKPVPREQGPSIGRPVHAGPRVGGEALRPVEPPRSRWEEPADRLPRHEAQAVARPKPAPVVVDSPAQPPRFEPRDEPRFEPREERRFEPREEPREEPRFEPREEPRFERREEPRFEAPAPEPPEARERPEIEERID